MRLSYVFAVVLVAILQTSGTARPVYEDSKQIVSADAGGAAKVEGERLLRGVQENIAAEDEERIFKKLGKYLKNIPQKPKRRLESEESQRAAGEVQEEASEDSRASPHLDYSLQHGALKLPSMRFTYILALVIAATLHASGTALPTEKNVKTPAIAADDANVDGGRMLRVVKKEANIDEAEAESEERVFKKLGAFIKKKWDKQTLKEALKRDKKRNQWIREQGFTPRNG